MEKTSAEGHQEGGAFTLELERRLSILAPGNQDVAPLGELSAVDYALIVLFGAVLPVMALLWGWP